MPIIAKVPHEIEQIFGPAATDKFVDFLNSTYLLQREEIVTVVSDRFEKNLNQQIGGVRLEIAEVRTEIADLRSEMRTDIAELRSEMRTEIAELRSEMRSEVAEVRTEIAELRAEMKTDFAGVQKEITGLHREISIGHREIATQTRWMLATAVSLVVLYPVVSRLVARLIP